MGCRALPWSPCGRVLAPLNHDSLGLPLAAPTHRALGPQGEGQSDTQVRGNIDDRQFSDGASGGHRRKGKTAAPRGGERTHHLLVRPVRPEPRLDDRGGCTVPSRLVRDDRATSVARRCLGLTELPLRCWRLPVKTCSAQKHSHRNLDEREGQGIIRTSGTGWTLPAPLPL